MYKSSLLLLLLCLLSPYTWSQDFNNYQLLKAEGPIPEDFLSSSTEKFQASVASIERNTNSRERNIKKRFYLESNFGIDDLLLSGRVLFNDPVSKYLNKVADEILSDDPELRKQLRFYVLKSPVPNAFTTEQGIVFVNLGLLPRLDNEAQLAFILCHEIAHFIEHHVIEGYVASAQIDLSKGEYRKTSDYEKLMLKNLYSQDHEMAADIKGFALFAKTKYAAESIPAVFEVLKNAEYPHISPQDPGTLFHTQTLDLGSFDEYHKERLELEAAASDDELDDTDDEEEPTRRKARRYRAYDNSEDEKKEKVSTTHPSPEKRRDAIIQELIKLQPTGEASFLVSEADFQRITQIANFELCDIFLQTTAYQDALHHILALREQYPRSDYLDFALVRALYGKAKYRLEGERHDEYMSYTDQEGILLHFHKYAKRINTKKLAALALSHSWEYLEAHTSHLHAEKIVEDLIVDLLDKYPGLEDKRSKKDTTLKLFFIELKKQENFTPILEKCIKEYERIEEFEEFQSTAKGRREIHKWEAKNQRKGYSLGVDTVVVFAPLYYRVDATKNKKPPVQYLASEEQQAIFHQYILENAENLNLKMILLDTKTLQKSDISTFNDAATTYAWYDERLRAEVKMIPSNYAEMQKLSEKYGTPYFVNMGAISLRRKPLFIEHPEVLLYSAYIVLLWPALPVVLYSGLKPRESSLSYTFVFDVEKNTTKMAYRNTQKLKAVETILGNNIYYMLEQIKRQP